MVAHAVVPPSRRGCAVMLGAVLALASAGASGQADRTARPAPPRDIALKPLASDLGAVTAIAHAGDSRLYIALRSGRIVVLDGERVRPSPLLDISGIVSCCGERGLLAVAFHPSYASNGFLFVAYTDRSGNLVLARYRRSRRDTNRVSTSSRSVLMTIPFPARADHHGGALQFGPDGFLYFGVGDGGTGAAASAAQTDDVRLGKILRLDVDSKKNRPPFFGIPRSNPAAGAASPANEIWARGLRDPWRFTFDRKTGDLYIGDVGQNEREEIDFQPASSYGGENYGWALAEGSLCRTASTGAGQASVSGLSCDSVKLQPPVLEYVHRFGDCAVVGGYVYRGSRFPELAGLYFYGDYCSGRIRASGLLTGAVAPKITTFGEDAAGDLYVATEAGTIYRIEAAPAIEGRVATMRRDPALPRAAVVRIVQSPPEPPAPRPARADEDTPPEEPLIAWSPTPVPTPPPTPVPAPPADFYVEPPPVLEPEPAPDQPPSEPPPPPPTAASPSTPDRQPPVVPPRQQPSPRPVEPRK